MSAALIRIVLSAVVPDPASVGDADFRVCDTASAKMNGTLRWFPLRTGSGAVVVEADGAGSLAAVSVERAVDGSALTDWAALCAGSATV